MSSSSRGHSIQNLYHCLTNSISQYTPCLGTDFIHSWFQSGVLYKTLTHTSHGEVLFHCYCTLLSVVKAGRVEHQQTTISRARQKSTQKDRQWSRQAANNHETRTVQSPKHRQGKTRQWKRSVVSNNSGTRRHKLSIGSYPCCHAPVFITLLFIFR